MTQAQLDLQNQLEQTNITDLTTQPICNDSAVPFLEALDQDPSVANSEQNSSSTDQIEHEIPPENIKHLQKQKIMNNFLKHLKQITVNNLMNTSTSNKSDMR